MTIKIARVRFPLMHVCRQCNFGFCIKLHCRLYLSHLSRSSLMHFSNCSAMDAYHFNSSFGYHHYICRRAIGYKLEATWCLFDAAMKLWLNNSSHKLRYSLVSTIRSPWTSKVIPFFTDWDWP